MLYGNIDMDWVISPRGKMVAILQMYIFRYNFVNENTFILMKIPLKLVTKDSIDNKPALV